MAAERKTLMSIFDVLTMLGGLCLFLFGMTLMGQALERRAGGRLRSLLGKMTTGRLAGFFTGLGVTAVIQSSSATTVMVVGFVNSGLMTLRQAINVIMGANVGTTVTAWLLSLGGISGDSIWVRLLKPTSFTPVLALAGIIFFMFCNRNANNFCTIFETHDFDTLRVTANEAYVFGFESDYDATICNEHDILIFADLFEIDKFSCFCREIARLDTFSASCLSSVFALI